MLPLVVVSIGRNFAVRDVLAHGIDFDENAAHSLNVFKTTLPTSIEPPGSRQKTYRFSWRLPNVFPSCLSQQCKRVVQSIYLTHLIANTSQKAANGSTQRASAPRRNVILRKAKRLTESSPVCLYVCGCARLKEGSRLSVNTHLYVSAFMILLITSSSLEPPDVGITNPMMVLS